MLPLGSTRRIVFQIQNAGTPVTGLTISSFSPAFLLRNGAPTGDAWTFSELNTQANPGPGYYQISYTPISAGTDYIEFHYPNTSFSYAASEDIVDFSQLTVGSTPTPGSGSTNNVTALTQDTGGAGALVPQVQDPASYTLYFYDASDWLAGNTDTSQALASTSLTAQGTWVSTPLYLIKGTYYLVLRNNSGTVIIFKANLAI